MANNVNLYGSGTTSDDAAREALVPERKQKAGTKKADDQSKIDPTASLYWREIERYNRAVGDWYQEGDEIEQVYLDESRVTGSAVRKFPILWTNVEVMKPAVFSKVPTVLASRRYKDRDPIGRTTAELLERATNTSLDLYNAEETFRLVRDDRLISGRGQAWVRYEATIETYDDEGGAVDEETKEVIQHERLGAERVCVDYVHWKDFGHNICRTWNDVWLVWRISFKTRDEVIERFGAKVADTLSYSSKSPGFGSGSKTDDADTRAKIFELWDRQRKRTCWMAEGQKTFLESGAPPIDFERFFPCPEPTYATKTAKQLIPVPDYRYYRDQAKEINDLTDKIGHMTRWLIVKGFIPGAPSGVSDPLEEAIREDSNGEMFQKVDSWKEWSDRGGTQELIQFFPVEKIIQTLQAAIATRSQLIADVFQITGISDILRGQTDPNETLGAQELKAQTGTRRLKNTQGDIARFSRDISRLVAEVVAEKFEPESIADITGFKYVPRAQMQVSPSAPGMMPGLPQMPGTPGIGDNGGPPLDDMMTSPENVFDERHIALMRNNRLRDFRIDIETDSTIQADENAEKTARMELLGAIGPYMAQVIKAAEAAPDLAPAMGEMLMFAVRGFRVGRSIEEVLEQSFNKATQRLIQKANTPPPPDPTVALAQGKLQVEGARVQNDARKDQADAQLTAQKQNVDAALTKRKQDIDASLQIRHQNMDATAQARTHAAKLLGDLQPTSIPQ